MTIKINHKIAVLLLSLFLFDSPSLLAQTKNEELKLNIQIRPRAEFRNGLFTPALEGQKPAAFIAQRSRLQLVYDKNKKLIIGISPQVVTTWGNDPQVQTKANDVSLYEAWAQFYFNPHWNIKLGRQVLSYDDQRILGALDWNNAGRKHDAVLMEYEKNKVKANAAVAWNQNAEKITNTFFDNSSSQPYKAMQFLWLKYNATDAFSFSILALNLNMQNRMDSSIANLQTIGSNLYFKKDKFNLNGSFYYQAGNNPVKNALAIKTSAWMAAFNAEYNFNKSFGLAAGSDYLSGKDMNDFSSKITYFNPLYGTHHKFYGFMDYFYVASPHNNVGLWDSYLHLKWKHAEKLNGQLAFHHFESAAKVVNYSGGKASSALGNEVDISIAYQVMDNVKLMGGYGQMFTNPSMKYVKSIAPNQTMKSFQNWIWLSVNINPEVLVYKSK